MRMLFCIQSCFTTHIVESNTSFRTSKRNLLYPYQAKDQGIKRIYKTENKLDLHKVLSTSSPFNYIKYRLRCGNDSFVNFHYTR